MIKVMTVFGTRPEAIKMAPVVKELQKHADSIQTVVAVTAQHRQMLDQVLELFRITPDYDLDIMAKGQTLYDITTKSLLGLKDVLAKEQPDLNWDNPETKEKIFDIIRFWNEKGVDGYRIDAISYLDKGLDGRADMNEPIGTVACVNLEGTHRYIREMVAETMTPDNLMSVGEVNINNEQDAINYSSAASKEFNMAIPFVPPIVEIQTWSPEKMKHDLKKDYEILKKDGWWARFLSNHDKPFTEMTENSGQNLQKCWHVICTHFPVPPLFSRAKNWE